jgi:hypothetical protein
MTRRPFAAALASLAFLTAAGDASAARGLKLGFTDSVFGADPLSNPWYGRAAAAGADQLDVTVSWGGVAPAKPTGDPTDPDNPAYDFAESDAQVRAAAAAGLGVIMRIANAPSWSDGPHRPRSITPGTWKTNAAAFGAFAQAAARHYDGAHGVPAVHLWQAGGEVNLQTYFAPQWVKRGKHLVAEAPRLYRKLLNAFYKGVKAVSPANTVIAAGLAPFGDPPGGKRMAPARFTRELLCLRGRGFTPVHCADPAHFDAISHHPYAIEGPHYRALNPDDVSVGDLGKLTGAVRKAVATGRALPRRHKGLYITEFSWDSKPPDPNGVPERLRARWISEVFQAFWRNGVSSVIWYQIRDAAGPFAETFQSGLYTRGGTPKRGLRAFRFPFVATRKGGTVWGRTPAAGTVAVQVRSGGRWRTVLRLHAGAHSVFYRRLTVGRHRTYRAVVGGVASLPYRAT